jgi:hypothetical protein
MATLVSDTEFPTGDPLDLIEQIVTANEWPYDRPSDQEMIVFVAGNWAEYNLHFAWSNPGNVRELGGLHVVCAFEGRVPKGSKAAIYELLAKINAQMWLGHFDLVPEEGLLMFRHGLMLTANHQGNVDQCERLIELALNECERFFPAFQFVLWGGQSPEQALEAAMFDTVGEA